MTAHNQPTSTQRRIRTLAKHATDILLAYEARVELAHKVTYLLVVLMADEAQPTEEQLQHLERLIQQAQKYPVAKHPF